MLLLLTTESLKAAAVGVWLDITKNSARELGTTRRGARDRPWVHKAPWHRGLQVPKSE